MCIIEMLENYLKSEITDPVKTFRAPCLVAFLNFLLVQFCVEEQEKQKQAAEGDNDENGAE